jgi:hypothetical protein
LARLENPLLVVTPETVVRWHRAGFQLYWRWLSKTRKQVGSKQLSMEVRELIFRMVAENPTWRAPRIHGELLMLGFDVSERTISRWMKRVPRDPQPAKRWRSLLENHREAIAAMDFFTVPTITFGVLYCLGRLLRFLHEPVQENHTVLFNTEDHAGDPAHGASCFVLPIVPGQATHQWHPNGP